MNKNVVLIYSGGVDSTTLLYLLIKKGFKIKTLSFDYGQKHRKELKMAKKTCNKLGIENKIINLRNLAPILKSALVGKGEKIPEGHYKDKVMKQTVVPNRNMIMLSIAMAYAISLKYSYIAYAAHSGDHEIYPDCRPIFVDRISKLAEVIDYKPVKILVPFINKTKTDIVRIGKKLNVDYSLTWSCYCGKKNPCLKCGTCVERIEAFKQNNMRDPLISEKVWKNL